MFFYPRFGERRGKTPWGVHVVSGIISRYKIIQLPLTNHLTTAELTENTGQTATPNKYNLSNAIWTTDLDQAFGDFRID